MAKYGAPARCPRPPRRPSWMSCNRRNDIAPLARFDCRGFRRIGLAVSMAQMTTEHGMTNSLPGIGTGVAAPVRFAEAIFWHVTPVTIRLHQPRSRPHLKQLRTDALFLRDESPQSGGISARDLRYDDRLVGPKAQGRPRRIYRHVPAAEGDDRLPRMIGASEPSPNLYAPSAGLRQILVGGIDPHESRPMF